MLNEKKLETLKEYLQRCVEEGTFPGCNCAVITKDDKWTCSVGYKQLVPEKEVNDLGACHDDLHSQADRRRYDHPENQDCGYPAAVRSERADDQGLHYP